MGGIWVHRQMWLAIVVFLALMPYEVTREMAIGEQNWVVRKNGKGVFVMTAPLASLSLACILSCQYILNYWHLCS
jgi:hypothetical protein